MFHRLGLIPGPDFARGVAAAVTDTTPEGAEALLEALVDAYLVEMPSTPGRYRFHDLLRLYARERVHIDQTDQDRDDALRRMLEWYIDAALMAQRFLFPGRSGLSPQCTSRFREPIFTGQDDAIAWFEAERASLVAAVDQAAQCGLHSSTWQLADALSTRYSLRSSWTDWHDVFQVGLAAARSAGNRQAEGWLMTSLGGMYFDLPQLDTAVAVHLESVAILQEVRDPYGEARALSALGRDYLALGRLEESLDCHLRSLAICKGSGDLYGEARSLSFLGQTYRALRRFDEALDHLHRGLAISHDWGQGISLFNLGKVYCDLYRFDEAIDCCQQSLAICREIGHRWGEGCALELLGDCLLSTDGREAARDCWEEALQIFTELGAPQAEEVRARLAGNAEVLDSNT
jgi:tetratricopeptide (TPR) repeat protein